jgi:hypothetical protein
MGSRTSNTSFDFLLIGHLLVCCDPWVNDESLAIAHVGQMAGHLHIIDYSTHLFDFSSLGNPSASAKSAQNASMGKTVLEETIPNVLTTPNVSTPPPPLGRIFFASS